YCKKAFTCSRRSWRGGHGFGGAFFHGRTVRDLKIHSHLVFAASAASPAEPRLGVPTQFVRGQRAEDAEVAHADFAGLVDVLAGLIERRFALRGVVAAPFPEVALDLANVRSAGDVFD